MPRSKQKAVISADAAQLAEVRGLIRAKRYRTVSEFVRAAIDEKLERLRSEQLAAQVDRYCDEDGGDDTDGLIAAQAFGKRPRRAKR